MRLALVGAAADGDNTKSVAGTVDASLGCSGGDGNDTLASKAAAAIADHLFARFGEGDDSVTHAGNSVGDLRVVSANAEETMDVADTAVIGGETDLGLDEQQDLGGRCRRGRGFGFHGGRSWGHFTSPSATLGALRFRR